MNKADIGFFEELEGVLANKRIATRGKGSELKLKEEKEGKSKKERKVKSQSVVNLLSLTATANPCKGCPLEPKPKLLQGVGDPDKAKLLVITEKVTESDLINQSFSKSPRYQRLLPLFQQQGFTEEDLYWVALTRCSGQENLEAVAHCAEYLRADLSKDNIKGSLILGLRAFQLLIDKDRSTIFYARGQIFELLGKPCLVTFADTD